MTYFGIMRAQFFLLFFLIAVSTARTPDEIVRDEVSRQENDAKLYAEDPTATIVLNDFDILVLFATVHLNMVEMKETIKRYFKTNQLNIKRYRTSRVMLQNSMYQLTTSNVIVTSKAGVKEAIKTIEHEVACMDESVECASRQACDSTPERLSTCMSFPFETFSDELKHIQRVVEEILFELEVPIGINGQSNLASANSRAKTLRERFDRVQQIDTKKWMDQDEVYSVFYIIDTLSALFEQLDSQLRINKAAKKVAGDSSKAVSLDAIGEFNEVLVKVEEALVFLTQVSDMNPADLKSRADVLRKKFDQAFSIFKATGMEVPENSEGRIHKISFLLTFF